MGNTNLPQAGAADTENSRDTRSGEQQLTDKEQKQRDRADKGDVGPAPSRPKNAPARVPGQLIDPEDREREEGSDDEKRDRNGSVEQPSESDPYNPENTTGAGDPAPLGGHANTGHSAADAT